MKEKSKQAIELPVEAFAILIKSAATAIVNEMAKPAPEVNTGFLHEVVGTLDELVGKFEILHHKEQDAK